MKIFDGTYDPDLCCALVDEYQNGCRGDRELLQEILLQIAPLVGVVAKLEIGSDPIESVDALKCDALEKVYELVEHGIDELPTDDPRSLMSFLYTTIKRSMMDSLRRSRHQMFECWELCLDPHTTRIPSHKDVEDRLYLSQIRDIVRALFQHDLRFAGQDRLACEFMAMCLLGFHNADPMLAQHKFKITRGKAKKLLAHTQIRIKSAYYVIKDME